MKAKSKLIETAGHALLPIYLQREKITCYQCLEDDSYDFVISVKGKFIRIKVRSVNGDAEYPSIGRLTDKQYKTCDFLIIYLLDNFKNRFFTIPIQKVPRNNPIRFTKSKEGKIKSKWMNYEGFDHIKKEVSFWLRK